MINMKNIAQRTSTQDIRGSPQCGAMPTNFFFFFISPQASYNPLLLCTKRQSQLHQGTGDLHAPR
jgi:hypothetical protein